MSELQPKSPFPKCKCGHDEASHEPDPKIISRGLKGLQAYEFPDTGRCRELHCPCQCYEPEQEKRQRVS